MPHAVTDLATAIDSTGAELVVISTPPYMDDHFTLLALAKGCHVLCEKPFARDAGEAAAMLETARASGKVHALGNEFRDAPARATVANALRTA